MSLKADHETGEDPLLIQQNLANIAEYILNKAKQQGCSSADVNLSFNEGFNVNVRMGGVDVVEHNRDKGANINVYFGKRKGTANTSDTRTESLDSAVQAACDIAKLIAEDDYVGLADKDRMAMQFPDLDLYHPWDIEPDAAIKLALDCEQKARDYDAKITNSEGASISTANFHHVYANTHGFIGKSSLTRHSLSCCVIAQDAEDMQRDYDFTVSRKAENLLAFDEVANSAAKRSLQRLNAKSMSTCQVPVIFKADIAKSLFSKFLAAVSGGNLYRKTTFLVDHLGKTIFPKHITISEHPHILQGLGSTAFDGEGIATLPEQVFVRDGLLESYILSSYSSRKLGLSSTANAGGVHNVRITHSDLSLTELVKQMHRGLLVTETMGHGVNILTGDYSLGACGFWVENGEIQYPVHEITVASNLRDMFQGMVAIANDVDYRSNVCSGSVLIDRMTVAGK